eukprot:2271804-Rhodomonas_salina.4
MPGTDIAYAANTITRHLVSFYLPTRFILLAYALAMQCPVLTAPTMHLPTRVLRDVRYRDDVWCCMPTRVLRNIR